MKLHCINSGSSGNCYLLESSNGEVLIIESGEKLEKVKQSLNFDISKIKGVILCLVLLFSL